MLRRRPGRLPPSGADAWHYDTFGARLEIMDSVRNIEAIIRRNGRRLDFCTPDELPMLGDNVHKLLIGLDPVRGLNEDLPAGRFAALLLGQQRNIDPDRLAEMLLRGMREAQTHIDAVARDSGLPVDLDDYLSIRGCESYFKDLLTQGGFQYSSNMEVMAAAEEWVRVSTMFDAPSQWFTLQTFIGSQKGPDMVRYMDQLGQIVESKSYGRIWRLLGTNSTTLARQVLRYVDALHATNPAEQLILRLPDGHVLEPHPEIIIRVDPSQYANLRASAQSNAVSMVDLEVMAREMLPGLNRDLRDYCRQMGYQRFRVVLQFTPLYLGKDAP
jgi:hypothetical protein